MSGGTQPLLPADVPADLVPAAPKGRKLSAAERKLLIGTLLCFLFMLAEIVGGVLAHSLAIMTDAAHMLSDVAGFLVSVVSLLLSSRSANEHFSFGYHRTEVRAARTPYTLHPPPHSSHTSSQTTTGSRRIGFYHGGLDDDWRVVVPSRLATHRA